MSDSYYMGAYWSNRRESSDECAERLIQFFVSLADIDEAFTRWFRLGRSRAEALSREVPLQKDLIRKLVERGGTRRYDDHSVIEGLGFGIGLWNGGPTKRLWVSSRTAEASPPPRLRGFPTLASSIYQGMAW